LLHARPRPIQLMAAAVAVTAILLLVAELGECGGPVAPRFAGSWPPSGTRDRHCHDGFAYYCPDPLALTLGALIMTETTLARQTSSSVPATETVAPSSMQVGWLQPSGRPAAMMHVPATCTASLSDQHPQYLTRLSPSDSADHADYSFPKSDRGRTRGQCSLVSLPLDIMRSLSLYSIPVIIAGVAATPDAEPPACPYTSSLPRSRETHSLWRPNPEDLNAWPLISDCTRHCVDSGSCCRGLARKMISSLAAAHGRHTQPRICITPMRPIDGSGFHSAFSAPPLQKPGSRWRAMQQSLAGCDYGRAVSSPMKMAFDRATPHELMLTGAIGTTQRGHRNGTGVPSTLQDKRVADDEPNTHFCYNLFGNLVAAGQTLAWAVDHVAKHLQLMLSTELYDSIAVDDVELVSDTCHTVLLVRPAHALIQCPTHGVTGWPAHRLLQPFCNSYDLGLANTVTYLQQLVVKGNNKALLSANVTVPAALASKFLTAISDASSLPDHLRLDIRSRAPGPGFFAVRPKDLQPVDKDTEDAHLASAHVAVVWHSAALRARLQPGSLRWQFENAHGIWLKAYLASFASLEEGLGDPATRLLEICGVRQAAGVDVLDILFEGPEGLVAFQEMEGFELTLQDVVTVTVTPHKPAKRAPAGVATVKWPVGSDVGNGKGPFDLLTLGEALAPALYVQMGTARGAALFPVRLALWSFTSGEGLPLTELLAEGPAAVLQCMCTLWGTPLTSLTPKVCDMLAGTRGGLRVFIACAEPVTAVLLCLAGPQLNIMSRTVRLWVPAGQPGGPLPAQRTAFKAGDFGRADLLADTIMAVVGMPADSKDGVKLLRAMHEATAVPDDPMPAVVQSPHAKLVFNFSPPPAEQHPVALPPPHAGDALQPAADTGVQAMELGQVAADAAVDAAAEAPAATPYSQVSAQPARRAGMPKPKRLRPADQVHTALHSTSTCNQVTCMQVSERQQYFGLYNVAALDVGLPCAALGRGAPRMRPATPQTAPRVTPRRSTGWTRCDSATAWKAAARTLDKALTQWAAAGARRLVANELDILQTLLKDGLSEALDLWDDMLAVGEALHDVACDQGSSSWAAIAAASLGHGLLICISAHICSHIASAAYLPSPCSRLGRCKIRAGHIFFSMLLRIVCILWVNTFAVDMRRLTNATLYSCLAVRVVNELPADSNLITMLALAAMRLPILKLRTKGATAPQPLTEAHGGATDRLHTHYPAPVMRLRILLARTRRLSG